MNEFDAFSMSIYTLLCFYFCSRTRKRLQDPIHGYLCLCKFCRPSIVFISISNFSSFRLPFLSFFHQWFSLFIPLTLLLGSPIHLASDSSDRVHLDGIAVSLRRYIFSRPRLLSFAPPSLDTVPEQGNTGFFSLPYRQSEK